MSIFRLLLLCIFALIVSSCQPAANKQANDASSNETTAVRQLSPETEHTCHFTVGFDAWEPYQYIDVGERVTGLDIELLSAVLQTMNCDFTFKLDTWVSLLNELKNGEVDILLGASKTSTREEFALFSEAYRMEEYSLYIRQEDAAEIKDTNIASFIEKGKLLGVVEDYYYGPEVSMLRDGSATSESFVSAIIGEVNVARLLDRDIDGFLEDSFVGASFIRRKALSDYIVAQGIKIQTGDTHVMFSKKNVSEKQVAQFNDALQIIKASEQYQDILKGYSQ